MENDRPRWERVLGVGFLTAALVTGATAQERAATDTATPGPEYGASGFHQFLWGSSYRDLWTATLEAPLLELGSVGGGLTPTGTGGGRQTLALRFMGADGLPYTFRVLDKDPTNMRPPELINTFAKDVLVDQVSAGFPTAPRVVDVLLQAVGIHSRDARVDIMPDDPRLREHR